MSKLDESELNELDDEVSEMKNFRKFSKRSVVQEDDPIKPRVDRFLSIVELPPEVLLLQQRFEAQIKAEEKKSSNKKQDSRKQSNKVRHYHDGSGLSQAERSKIIRDILNNFDLDKYLRDFCDQNVIEIKLEKNKPENRAVRERILKLMKSDVIRINDINYMRELSKRIEEHYQDEQEKLLKDLEEREKRRERNLIARGLLDKPYD